eukprot:TRINITY_DN10575_c0_g1_i1.p1 TRINITY_DN10575_c0_g1~~TRINITY_DN10575_c0_g1_i1.p1  ORF type:complete len:328 (+),score=74.16 TRINITY_DN10575_c0_g1_i1:1-984(+)
MAFTLLHSICATYLLLAILAQADVTPTVGVLTTPTDGSPCETAASVTAGAGSCFETFYVKWLESAGLRVAIIPYDANATLLTTIIDSVNGVLFTGGELGLQLNSTYYHTAQTLFAAVKRKNDNGVDMPLWATCMGFQLLHIIVTGDENVLTRDAYDSEDLSLNLELTPESATSRFFQSLTPGTLTTLRDQNVTSNLHHDGIEPSVYTSGQYPELASFFEVLSINHDRAGKPFVSTVEAKQYPIYATQWHPERPQFEWVVARNINHDVDAIVAMADVSHILTRAVRANDQYFRNKQLEDKLLIYHYNPVADPDSSSYQYYVFPAFDWM